MLATTARPGATGSDNRQLTTDNIHPNTYTYFADFKDPLHLLIICCTGVIYMPVILGLVALGAHVNKAILRVLARLDERT